MRYFYRGVGGYERGSRGSKLVQGERYPLL